MSHQVEQHSLHFREEGRVPSGQVIFLFPSNLWTQFRGDRTQKVVGIPKAEDEATISLLATRVRAVLFPLLYGDISVTLEGS